MVDPAELQQSLQDHLASAPSGLAPRQLWAEHLPPREATFAAINSFSQSMQQGGFSAWVIYGHCGLGELDLQRVVAAILHEQRELDPLVCAVALGLCEAADRLPRELDPRHPDAQSGLLATTIQARDAVERRYGFLLHLHQRLLRRALGVYWRIVETRDATCHPLTLPGADQAVDARAGLPALTPSKGPVRFPSIAVGLSPAGAELELCAAGPEAFELALVTAGALWVGGAPLEEIEAFNDWCRSEQPGQAAVIERCCALVDVDGALARGEGPAAPAEICAALAWRPAPFFTALSEAATTSNQRFLILTPGLDELGGGPAAHKQPVVELRFTPGQSLADQFQAHGDWQSYALLDAGELDIEDDDACDEVFDLLFLPRRLVVIGAPQELRDALARSADDSEGMACVDLYRPERLHAWRQPESTIALP